MKTHRISRSMNYLNRKFQDQPRTNPTLSCLQIKRSAHSHFTSKYASTEITFNTKMINELIRKANTHAVASLKDNLLFGDKTDYLHKSYKRSEIKLNLPQILEYYNSCSVIFPNYVVLYESKYIYKNIQRKQKVIDDQQRQEMELENKINCSFSSSIQEAEDKVFDTQVFDSLLNQTNTSSIQQLLGVQFDNRMESFERMETICQKENSIEALIEHINQSEKCIKPFIERPTHSSVKKYSKATEYSNCTITTKDKSSSISNQPCKRKLIICNKISNSKDTRIIKHKKHHPHKSPSRPISNEASYNSSFCKEKLHISSSSKNTFTNYQISLKATSHIKNTLSMPKMDTILLKAPITSREKKSKNGMIDLLASRIIKMKPMNKVISQSESKLHLKQSSNNVNLALSLGISSLNRKIFKMPSNKIDNSVKKRENSSINNKSSNTNLLSYTKPAIKSKEHRSNSKMGTKTVHMIKSNKEGDQYSVSPNNHITNAFITKTCTHLPLKNCILFHEEAKKTLINNHPPQKEPLIKNLQLNRVNYLNRNDSRNDCNTDRTYNKEPSFRKALKYK